MVAGQRWNLASAGAASLQLAGATDEGPSPVAVPTLPPAQVPELAQKPTWSGEPDRRPEAGPMYPDLVKQAVAGTSLADVVTVNRADGTSTRSLDVSMSGLGLGGLETDHDDMLVSTSARTPAEIGAFTGASAKRRWRLHR